MQNPEKNEELLQMGAERCTVDVSRSLTFQKWLNFSRIFPTGKGKF